MSYSPLVNSPTKSEDIPAPVDVIIKLKSKDEEEFEVEKKVACMSITIKTMLDNLGVSDGDTEAIPLNTVPSHILKLVLEWAKHHKDDPAPEADDDDDDERRAREIPQWDQEFLSKDDSTIFELITAANFLDMKGLLSVACKAVAKMINGKTAEEIRQRFDIEDDFTPEEKDKIGKDNEWCQEK